MVISPKSAVWRSSSRTSPKRWSCRWREAAGAHRSPFAGLARHPHREEQRTAASIVPEQPRTEDTAPVPGQVGPRIIVHVGLLLQVRAAQKRETPALRQWRRVPEDRIGAPTGRGVQEHLGFGLVARAAGDEVDDSSHGPGAVQRGGDALDDFHLTEIHRWDLKQADPAGLRAEQRQAVRQHARVAPLHPLHTYAGGPQRGGGGLHPHPAHLVEHHDDVPWCHEHLLLDLLANEDLDAHRLILEPLVGACGRHGDLFFVRGFGIERHDDGLTRPAGHDDVFRHREKSGMCDFDADRPGMHRHDDDPALVGGMWRSADHHLRAGDRFLAGPNLDANRGLLRRSERRVEEECHDEKHPPQYFTILPERLLRARCCGIMA